MSIVKKKQIKDVTISPGCITCGLCEFIAPDVFTVTDVSHVKKDANFQANAVAIKKSAQECPVQVITYKEDYDETNKK